MQELRFVAVSEDGRYAVLAVPGRSARFTLPIDERLRAVALGQTSRLAQYEIEVESPLRPKEIQARIRAGETVEEIADAAGIAVERVRWFEGPVLAERAYMADQAQLASVRRQGDATPGPRLGEIVTERLKVVRRRSGRRAVGREEARRRKLAGGADLHLRRPPAHRRVDVRSAPQARAAGRRQRRPDVAAGDRAAPAGRAGAWRGDRDPPGPEAGHLAGDPAHGGPGATPRWRAPDPATPRWSGAGPATSGWGAPGSATAGGPGMSGQALGGRLPPSLRSPNRQAPEPREAEAPAAAAPSVAERSPGQSGRVAAQSRAAAPAPAGTSVRGAAGPQPGRLRSQEPGSPRLGQERPAASSSAADSAAAPPAAAASPTAAGRSGGISRRGRPADRRGRAGGAPGPQGGARQAILGAVLGRDHVR